LNNSIKLEGRFEACMLDEIAALGYERPTVTLLHHTITPIEKVVVDIILKWLPNIYEESIGTGHHLLWSLLNSADDFNPEALIKLYEQSDLNEILKQAIAIMLSTAKVGNISTYLRNCLLNYPASHASAGFLSAIDANCNFESREELINFIQIIFTKFIYYEKVFILYNKYAWKEDIEFLLQVKAEIDNNKYITQLSKLIAKISNKKRKPLFKPKRV
jgi:hypothetical protein